MDDFASEYDNVTKNQLISFNHTSQVQVVIVQQLYLLFFIYLLFWEKL